MGRQRKTLNKKAGETEIPISEIGHGAQGRNRTTDTAIFSRMLYQLSYLGVAGAAGRGGGRVYR